MWRKLVRGGMREVLEHKNNLKEIHRREGKREIKRFKRTQKSKIKPICLNKREHAEKLHGERRERAKTRLKERRFQKLRVHVRLMMKGKEIREKLAD